MNGNEKKKFSGGLSILTPVEKMDTLLYGVKYKAVLVFAVASCWLQVNVLVSIFLISDYLNISKLHEKNNNKTLYLIETSRIIFCFIIHYTNIKTFYDKI